MKKSKVKKQTDDIFIANEKVLDAGPKTIEEKYQKKSQIEHILLRPDTYIGDISLQKEMMWVWDKHLEKIIKKEIEYVPGLYKIFDEILVNARDHNCNDPTCDIIKVSIDKETNIISVYNNGTGIPIVKHAEHKMYIPEMLFGELLTSTNYDDTEKRTTGGRNGYGAKLTNVFSTFFSIETTDGKSKYYQEFTNNLSARTEPKITELKTDKQTYTKITFKPDLVKFKLNNLTDDIIALMSKRVIDMAGISNKVKIYLNDKKIDVNNFKKYINLYELNIDKSTSDNDSESNSNTENELKEVLLYEETDRWKLGIMYIPDCSFEQISFVNGICTYHGGNHVDYVVSQIIKKLEIIIIKKYKEAKIKSNTIKDNLVIFLESVVDNPAFTSQTKETLKTKISDFGSTFEPSDKIIKKLASSGIVDQIINMAKLKEESFLKKSDGKKTVSIKGIPKLEDANWAGTKKSKLCKLILTEGDSAKALAMAGRSIIGSDAYGIFPLKGKLLNVRDASPKQLLENEEIINIKKIIGLQHNKTYTDINELRYGGIILMCDQDYDGFHIKGLLMNFFHYFWPSLLQFHNYIYALATPIVKATKIKNKTKDVKVFYNLSDYENWKKSPSSGQYSIKYYKGLGTSTKEEAKEYFEDIENKLIKYTWNSGQYSEPNEDTKLTELDDNLEQIAEDQEESVEDEIYKKVTKNSKKIFGVSTKYINDCTESITLAFEKKRANCRKVWLRNYNKDRILSNDQKSVPIPDFIHKEMIHFSNDDINRSIPSLVDGLKPSTRKILYGAILRKLNSAKDEIKVAQLSGFVSDKTCYHHGEASLNGAIIGMAQNFVGSNNINILYPAGQYGSRLVGGKDFASPRYIFTYLAELTRLIFRPEDDDILHYLDDDGILVEPEWFCPILPMILVNGAEGIGTGFSTTIGQYNPIDIVENLKLLMANKTPKVLIPFYRNFTGSIETIKQNEYIIKGTYRKISEDTIKITELPIGLWTTAYKEFLESKTEKIKSQNPMIETYKSNYTDETIDFIIQMDPNLIDKLESSGQIWSKLKLSKPLTLNNQHLYNTQGQITKYNSTMEILMEFYETRLMMYTKRKEFLIGKLSKELDILKYKKLFIEMVLDNQIVIYRQKKDIIIDRLIELKFPKLISNNYEYITDIPLFNLTQEKIDELNEKYNSKAEELFKIQSTTEITQWTIELDEFLNAYNEWIIKHSNLDNKPSIKKKLVKKN
jgi:DNA topoisomerase-2